MNIKNMKLSKRLLLDFGMIIVLMVIIIIIEIITINNLSSRKDRLVNADAINESTQIIRRWTLDYYITNSDEATTNIDEYYNITKANIDNGLNVYKDENNIDILRGMSASMDEYYTTFLKYKDSATQNYKYSKSMDMASAKVAISINNLNARQNQSIGLIKAKSNNMTEKTDKDELIFDLISEYDIGQSAENISQNMLNVVVAEQMNLYRGQEAYDSELYIEFEKLKENCDLLYENYEREQDKAMIQEIIGFADDYIELYESYKVSLIEQETLEIKLEELASEITNSAGLLADEQENKMKSEMVGAIIISIILGFVIVVLADFIAFMLIKRLNKFFKNSIKKLSNSSNLISNTSIQLSDSSNELSTSSAMQAAAIEETSATMEETSSMIKQNTDNTQRANDISKDANNAALESSEQIKMMVDSMDNLSKSSEEISKIIKVIDDIAFQTNMLALNAAVEAARAGDAGLGFAVVAQEVRNLAQKSADAAKDTSEIIDKNIELSHNSSLISNNVANSLNQIIEKTKDVNQIISEIAEASCEQEKGVSQVSLAISEIENSVQQNSQTADDNKASAKELSVQYKGLNQVVDELERLINGVKNNTEINEKLKTPNKKNRVKKIKKSFTSKIFTKITSENKKNADK